MMAPRRLQTPSLLASPGELTMPTWWSRSMSEADHDRPARWLRGEVRLGARHLPPGKRRSCAELRLRTWPRGRGRGPGRSRHGGLTPGCGRHYCRLGAGREAAPDRRDGGGLLHRAAVAVRDVVPRLPCRE